MNLSFVSLKKIIGAKAEIKKKKVKYHSFDFCPNLVSYLATIFRKATLFFLVVARVMARRLIVFLGQSCATVFCQQQWQAERSL